MQAWRDDGATTTEPAQLKILPTALLACLAACPALARPLPNPPPSGITVHLFGPDSIGSQILPDGASTTGGAKPSGGADVAPASQARPEPTWGQIAHEMFVTGDPAQEAEPRFATGRAGQHAGQLNQ